MELSESLPPKALSSLLYDSTNFSTLNTATQSPDNNTCQKSNPCRAYGYDLDKPFYDLEGDLGLTALIINLDALLTRLKFELKSY